VAILWVKLEKDLKPAWAIFPLDGGDLIDLSTDTEASPVKRNRKRAMSPKGVILGRTQAVKSRETWVLLNPQSIPTLVNGEPVLTGIRVLRNKDEIRIAGTGRRFYYSTERLARVERFAGSEPAVFCPRCKREISEGSEAVRCPQCQIWHHQSEELDCWTYSSSCSLCDQSTGLDTGYRWTPEAL
jgi:hypothetical protein